MANPCLSPQHFKWKWENFQSHHVPLLHAKMGPLLEYFCTKFDPKMVMTFTYVGIFQRQRSTETSLFASSTWTSCHLFPQSGRAWSEFSKNFLFISPIIQHRQVFSHWNNLKKMVNWINFCTSNKKIHFPWIFLGWPTFFPPTTFHFSLLQLVRLPWEVEAAPQVNYLPPGPVLLVEVTLNRGRPQLPPQGVAPQAELALVACGGSTPMIPLALKCN